MEMEKLKEKLKVVQAIPNRLKVLQAFLMGKRPIESSTWAIVILLISFVLSGAGVRGHSLPFGVCLIGVASTPLLSIGALLGSGIGYLFFWGFRGGLEYFTVGVLVFAAVSILNGMEISSNKWFRPALVAGMSTLVGILYLIQGSLSVLRLFIFLGRIGLAGLSTHLFIEAKKKDNTVPRLYMLACVIAGLSAITLFGGLNLGQICTAALCVASLGTPSAVVICTISAMSLELTSALSGCGTILCFSALICHGTKINTLPYKMVLYILAIIVGVLFTGGLIPELIPTAAIGCCLGMLIPPTVFGEAETVSQPETIQKNMKQVSVVLGDMAGRLRQDPKTHSGNDEAQVFDKATDKICSRCVLWNQCWQQNSEQTYVALCSITDSMWARSMVSESDFPAIFTEKCCHLDNLIRAINLEVDNLLSRRQYHNRMHENRRIIANQYENLSTLLVDTANQEEQSNRLEYRPEMGMKGTSKKQGSISGDRGACFRTEQGMYYVILCDGMGSGWEAAAESSNAIDLLAGLIRGGVAPDKAMETLNGLYILRGDGGFSTVDLLEMDLKNGRGNLYKWGAAHSYLIMSEGVKKIGTAVPPPGLGVGETHKAEVFELSLRGGETLVLLSDGADGEDVGRKIVQLGNSNPKDITAALIEHAKIVGGDDMTAVALRLCPLRHESRIP